MFAFFDVLKYFNAFLNIAWFRVKRAVKPSHAPFSGVCHL
ncbi:hypothetical protein CAMGR0001_2095 [Campylobacter gracilis RM3268]|uniref:Uncharacterized protein n=1 Tax=Campylobacter gracilis RM3268 TaxID=553220 RepID=C8PLT5_9BACT|nr:hypothetical protein CAMGR0001_2095 [Campylobacter gracilis RM3268]